MIYAFAIIGFFHSLKKIDENELVFFYSNSSFFLESESINIVCNISFNLISYTLLHSIGLVQSPWKILMDFEVQELFYPNYLILQEDYLQQLVV